VTRRGDHHDLGAARRCGREKSLLTTDEASHEREIITGLLLEGYEVWAVTENLLTEEWSVIPGREGDDVKMVGVFGNDIERLRANGARRAQDRYTN
jgi:hypothetical protein